MGEDKISPFEFVKRIESEKHFAWHPEERSSYVPFVINRALSGGVDTVMQAQEMNQRWWLPHDMQYCYLFHSVTKRRRYNKWVKKHDRADVQILIDAMHFNVNKAKAALRALTPAQLEELRGSIDPGGCTKR